MDHTYEVQDVEEMTSSTGTASDGLVWRKARISVNNGACVEVATHPRGVHIRDSKDERGFIISCGYEEWRAFLHGARQGDFDGLD